LPAYKAKRVAVVGVSNDGVEKNSEFARECGFSYPLICDTGLAISVAYGAAADSSASSAKRMAVLIDWEGKVEQVWPSVDARSFPTECLQSLREPPPTPLPTLGISTWLNAPK